MWIGSDGFSSSTRSAQARRVATIPMGTFTKKIQRHPIVEVMSPPRISPATAPTTIETWLIPRARPRSFGGKASVMIAAEFEKSFGVFRNRKFKGALSAEFRFHETASPLYDLVTIYGMKSEASLQEIAGGYEAIVKSMPELSADGVS